MAEPIRWGIISTANIGKNKVIPGIERSYNGVVAAVASRNLESAQAFASELGIPKAYGSYEELIADPDIDAIYNPLPNSLHAEWSIKCAEAGKPSLCEKPLASDAAEAQTIVDAFAQRNVLFAEAFMYRFHPRTEQVKELVNSGAVGDITAIQATFSFDIGGRDGDIRLNKSLAGGALMDIGCYCVNAMRLMTGEEPETVKALAQIGEKSGVDETLVGVMEFPSGAMGHFDCSFRAPFTSTYEIRGSKGRIYVDPAFVPNHTDETTIHYWNDEGHKEIVLPPFDQYQLMAENFASAILTHHEPRFHPQDAVQNMVVIDKLYASLNS
ncbi:Gfo/Idh/MocA family protein [Chloroflexota bacterium]